MNSKKDLQQKVFRAARDQGLSSVLFRKAIGKKLGLNVTDYECLSILAIKGGSTPTELARHTGLTSGSATAMLDRLEKRGFIKRTRNSKDRRGVIIEINKEYGKFAAPLVAGVQKAHQQMIAGYSAKELETIADFLTRFTQNVTEATRKIEGDM